MKRLNRASVRMRLNDSHPGWWLSGAVLALLFLWIGYCYSATVDSMVAIWSRSATFTHGFFILPISLWLIWRKREELLKVLPTPAPTFLLIVLFSSCVWLIGAFFEANVVKQFAFVAIVVASVVSVLGIEVGRLLLFPLLFLFFAVPTGEFLLPFLMKATADFTVLALRISGIPVHREGLQFVIPTGTWSVVEACSGIRYLIASITVGSLFAYLNYKSWRRRALFIAIAVLIPLIANWIRAYLIVLIGHLSDNRLAAGVDHLIYGWAFFGVVLTIMFLVGVRWSEAGLESPSASKASTHLMIRPDFSLNFLRLFTAGAIVLMVSLPVSIAHTLNASTPVAATFPEGLNFPDELSGGWLRSGNFRAKDMLFNSSTQVDGGVIRVDYQSSEMTMSIAISVGQMFPTKTYHVEPALEFTEERSGLDQLQANRIQMYCGDRSVEANALDVDQRNTGSGDNGFPTSARQFFYVDGKTTGSRYVARAIQGLKKVTGHDSRIFSVVFQATGVNAAERVKIFVHSSCPMVLDRLHRTAQTFINSSF